MLARTPGTYAKLEKTITGTPDQIRAALRAVLDFSAMPWRDITKCTRGRNDIYYWRPAGGRFLNEKVAMIYYAADGSAALYI